MKKGVGKSIVGVKKIVGVLFQYFWGHPGGAMAQGHQVKIVKGRPIGVPKCSCEILSEDLLEGRGIEDLSIESRGNGNCFLIPVTQLK